MEAEAEGTEAFTQARGGEDGPQAKAEAENTRWRCERSDVRQEQRVTERHYFNNDETPLQIETAQVSSAHTRLVVRC